MNGYNSTKIRQFVRNFGQRGGLGSNSRPLSHRSDAFATRLSISGVRIRNIGRTWTKTSDGMIIGLRRKKTSSTRAVNGGGLMPTLCIHFQLDLVAAGPRLAASVAARPPARPHP